MTPPSSSPLGLHRVIDPPGVLPQAAWQLDATPAIAPDEVRIRVDRLNLDAASYRHLRETYAPTRTRSAPPSWTSSPPAAKCRTPSPIPAAC